MRMVDWVHCHTSNSWPASPLGLVLVPLVSSLADRLVRSSSTGNDANHGSAVARNGPSGSTWQSNSSLSAILGMSDDDSRGATGPGKGSSVTSLSFTVGDNSSFRELVHWENIADIERSLLARVDELPSTGPGKGSSVTSLSFAVRDNSSFWELVHWENIADIERSLLARVDELPSMEALHCYEILNSVFVSVGVPEHDLCKRSSTAGVMQDFLHHSLDVPFSFGVIKSSEFGRSDSL
eukprot:CAMPEP_0202977276 /NCGR_PEP_ID=MMETSP1396-20130829/84156_1 /ASSEMBLY_ACC=CAM_ASM_000872 /TAXON_ID= /ORGANISM="Pseudokeronopsis sp., Strain Brazil" /LENGTH=237 /DNA_ID=CAMNT_0049716003 /DNA_START=212 /DNA_END=925 /DNA_ORIENTATION=+